jgi:hypothetical protein
MKGHIGVSQARKYLRRHPNTTNGVQEVAIGNFYVYPTIRYPKSRNRPARKPSFRVSKALDHASFRDCNYTYAQGLYKEKFALVYRLPVHELTEG